MIWKSFKDGFYITPDERPQRLFGIGHVVELEGQFRRGTGIVFRWRGGAYQLGWGRSANIDSSVMTLDAIREWKRPDPVLHAHLLELDPYDASYDASYGFRYGDPVFLTAQAALDLLWRGTHDGAVRAPTAPSSPTEEGSDPGAGHAPLEGREAAAVDGLGAALRFHGDPAHRRTAPLLVVSDGLVLPA